MSQLRKLATPFSGKWVQKAPQGKYGDYVSHSTINERLLRDLGPFSFELVEVVRGYAPQIDTKKVTYPARENAVVGVVARLTAVVDGREVRIEEAGSEENPAMHNDGENVKTALSDALKRCAMRLGVGLHLWSGDLYFLDQALDKEAPAPKPTPAPRASVGDAGEPDAAEEPEGEFPPEPDEKAAAVIAGRLDEGEAARLHAKLGAMGIASKQQAAFAAAVLGEKRESFTELTKHEAAAVFHAGEDVQQGRIEFRGGKLVEVDPDASAGGPPEEDAA